MAAVTPLADLLPLARRLVALCQVQPQEAVVTPAGLWPRRSGH